MVNNFKKIDVNIILLIVELFQIILLRLKRLYSQNILYKRSGNDHQSGI